LRAIAGGLVAVLFVMAPAVSTTRAGDAAPRLAYLLHVHQELGRGGPGDLLRGHGDLSTAAVAGVLRAGGRLATAAALQMVTAETLSGSIRFHEPPDRAVFDELRALGVTFTDFGSGPAGSATVFPARMPWSAADRVAQHPAVLQLSPAWRVAPRPPLAISRPQVQADQVWEVLDPGGRPVTGEGSLIADIDTGINYFHPAFFFADGDTVDWIDIDLSGGLSSGDVVDLDGNHQADPGEALDYIEAAGVEDYGNDPSMYDTDFDWLYNDADENQSRDYGPAFGEMQPGYGELLFVALDCDEDGRLDPGERLVTLCTSKVRAVRGRNGSVAERGVDLLTAELDYYGHGTPVSGILCGGIAGISRMCGMAPGAEMLHAINDYVDEPPFLVPMEEHLAWAATYDPDVFLIEDGEWVWEYMDGSSNVETMLNEYAAEQNIIQVVPAGNLATGNMHTRFASTASTALHASDYACICWLDFLWQEPHVPLIIHTVPGGASSALDLSGTTQEIGAYEVYSSHSISPRGTQRIDVRIEHMVPGTPISGTHGFDFTWDPAREFDVHGYFVDDVSGWISASFWNATEQQHTVTWPATADSAISIAAYDPEGDGDIVGYSGWGPRIDGRPAVDIAAPGAYVYSTHAVYHGEYVAFNGTSAAGPHAAGAVALLRQLMPELGSGACRNMIRRGAQVDPYTTDPNRWGAGKLRIRDALAVAGIETDAASPSGALTLLPPAPNPAVLGTTIRLRAQRTGPVDLSIYDLSGRQCLQTRLPVGAPGLRIFSWDGHDSRGRPMPAGAYYVRIAQGDAQAETRILLIR
jgi:subtilisin family serine protease